MSPPLLDEKPAVNEALPRDVGLPEGPPQKVHEAPDHPCQKRRHRKRLHLRVKRRELGPGRHCSPRHPNHHAPYTAS